MKFTACIQKFVFAVKIRQIKPFPENAAAVIFMVCPHVHGRCCCIHF
ncbi:hypothetical protein CSC18_4915 [Klebsiella aerogenes]|nr:hypothetical protein CSC18_4915 [Klebsiella aerogenes]